MRGFEKISFEQFKKDILDDNKVYEEYTLPKRNTKYSAGYDIYSPFDIILEPGKEILIPTGIRCKMDNDAVLCIFPRSGLGFKYRLQLNNTVGIIDSDYYYSDNRGHIFIKLTNDTKENKTVEIKKGYAFAQGIFLNYGITKDDESENVRNGGLGSTSGN